MPMHSNGGRVKSRINLRWARLKVWNGSKNLAIFHGRVRDDTKGGWEKKKQCIGIRFLPQEFYWFFLTCSKSAKWWLVQSHQNDYFNCDLFKGRKMTYDLFKFSKMTTMFFDLLKVSTMTNRYDLLKVSCA